MTTKEALAVAYAHECLKIYFKECNVEEKDLTAKSIIYINQLNNYYNEALDKLSAIKE